MRVVVVGASGNAGTSVLSALADEPAVDSVLGIARRAPSLSLPKASGRGRTSRATTLEPLFRGADAVVHLAWLIQPSRDGQTLRATNVDGSRRVFEAVAAAGVPALVYASSVGAYSPGPKDRAVDESWPTDGITTLVLLAPQGRGRAAARRLRGRAPRGARRAAAAGADLQARRRQRDPALLRRPAAAQRARAAEPHPDRARHAAPALPGRALARRRRRLPARGRRRGRARGLQRRRRAGARPGAAGRAARRAPVPVPARVLRARGGADLARPPAADARGLGRHGARRPDHGHHARPRGARLGAAPRRRRGAARAARRHGRRRRARRRRRSHAGGSRLRELAQGVGARL